MKKALVAILIVVLLLVGMVGAAWFYFPTFAFYMIGKAMGGSVEASHSTVGFKNGLLTFTLVGVKVKGTVEGRIGKCELDLVPSRGIYIKRFAASDFDIKIQKGRGRLTLVPVPVELAEIGKGILDYGGRKYTVRSLRVTNFNIGKGMEFSLDAGIEGIGDVKTHGEGIFGDSHSDIKGDFRLFQVNLARLLKDYDGLVDSQGSFSYREGKLVVDGQAQTARMSIMEDFLLRRLPAEHAQCQMHAEWADDAIDISLKGLSFDGAPLTLDFRTRGKELLSLHLAMDYVPIPDLAFYLNLAALSDKDWAPFSYVKDGKVRVGSFVFTRGKPVQARIDLKDARGGDGNIFVRGAEGTLQVDGRALLLSNFSGLFGEGRIYGVSGTIPLKAGQDLKIIGKYALQIKDLNQFNKAREIEATGGSAEGTFELAGRIGRPFKVGTAGVLRDGQFLWKGVAFRASTDYSFAEGGLAFDHLLLESGGTSLVAKGKVNSLLVSVSVKGTLDATHITRLFMPGQPLHGSVDVDGQAEVRDGSFFGKGWVNMTRLVAEIPGIVRKSSGIESAAFVSAHGREGLVFVDDLYFTAGEAKVWARFDAMKGRISNLHITVDAPKIERLAGLFFFDRAQVRGDLKADLRAGEIRFPLTRLPAVTGDLSLANGSFRLPFMAKPFQAINLACSLKGDRLVLDVSGLRTGTSLLASSRLVVEGADAPSFSLVVDMTRLNPSDFATRDGRALKLPVIPDGSLLSRAKGTFSMKIHELEVGRMTGRDLSVTGMFADRTLTVNEGRLAAQTGRVSFQGNLRMKGQPQVSLTGELKDVTAQEAFSLLGGSTDILDGTGSINGTLKLTGRTGAELARSASGTISIASRDGAVRKWNLLSKLLALTNVYELLRGRVDLSRSGLVYRRFSASFEGKNGLFHTDNFLIDSPSMIVAGQGDVDVGKKTIDAKMVVSPLVEMDRLIDWIPILRSIVKEKKSGLIFFIYNVKGPLSDPEIKSSYVRSVGKRAFDIIWNAIRLPKSVVDSLPDMVDRFPKGLLEQ